MVHRTGIKIFTSLLLSFLLTTSCFAQPKWQRFDFFKLNGGLNDGFSDLDIADNEASAIKNVVLTTGGNIKTRDGYAKLNASTLGSSTVGTAGYYYRKANGDEWLVTIWDDDKIRKMDYEVGGGPDGTWDDITGALSFNVGQNDLGDFVVGEDTLIIEDGLDSTAPYKWTGSGNAAALGGSPPNAKYVAFYKNMAFLAGNDSNPSTLYFSDIGDIENWSTGLSGNINVETNDGSVITALHVGYDALYIWKGRTIFRLTGADKDTFELQRLIADKGTMSNLSVQRVGNDFFFMSSQGEIILYDGGVNIQKISSKIEGTIDALAFNRFAYTPAVIYYNDYYINATTVAGSTNDTVLVFDTFHLAWTKFDGINANIMFLADDGVGEDMIVFLDYCGFGYNYPSGTNDNGTAISASYSTKQFVFPQMTPEKYLKLVKVFTNEKGNYNLNIEVRTDYESTGSAYAISLLGSSSTWGTATYGSDEWGGQNLIIGRIEPDKGEDFFKLRFYNNNVDEPFEIKGFQMFLEPSSNI